MVSPEDPTFSNRIKPLFNELTNYGYETNMFFPGTWRDQILESSPQISSGSLFWLGKVFEWATRPEFGKFFFPISSINDPIMVFRSMKHFRGNKFNYDAIYVSKSLLGTAFSGILLGRKWKIPVILDLDDYDIHHESYLLEKFQGIVVASNELSNQFKKFNPVYVPNSADLRLFNSSRHKTKKEKPPVIVWSGNMSGTMNLEAILESFTLLKGEAKLVFMGRGQKRQKMINLVKSLHLESKVSFSEWIDRQKIPAFLSKTSIGVIYLSDTLWERCKCPVKMFKYMAMELPIVATDVGEVAYTIKKANCGILVPPDDPSAMAEALDNLIQNPKLRLEMGKRGREYVIKRQNYTILGKRLKDYIEQIVEHA